MVKDVRYLVTHSLRCKTTDRLYDHSEDCTNLHARERFTGPKSYCYLRKKKEMSLCWIGSNPGLNMLNFARPPFWDGKVGSPRILSPVPGC